MRMVDLIFKKRDGHELSDEEIKFWIDGYVKGEVPDYQSSAMNIKKIIKFCLTIIFLFCFRNIKRQPLFYLHHSQVWLVPLLPLAYASCRSYEV